MVAARPEIGRTVDEMVKKGKWTTPGYDEKFGSEYIAPTSCTTRTSADIFEFERQTSRPSKLLPTLDVLLEVRSAAPSSCTLRNAIEKTRARIVRKSADSDTLVRV